MSPGRVDARDDEALPTTVLVFVLTAEVIPLVAEFVFAFTTAAIDVDAVPTVEVTIASVFALTTAARELEAVEMVVFVLVFTEETALDTSLAVARDPESSPAPVSVRVVFDHTSATSVPKPESVREV
mgnify:CR=1 FL=1